MLYNNTFERNREHISRSLKNLDNRNLFSLILTSTNNTNMTENVCNLNFKFDKCLIPETFSTNLMLNLNLRDGL